MKTRLLLALATLLLPTAALAQTVVTLPNTVNTTGQPLAVNRTFIVNADGSVATIGLPRGGSTIATGQVTIATTATLVAAARAGRQRIGVTVTPAIQCAFGPAGVTLATGWPLAAVAYATDNWDTAAALYGVCASSATVAYRELF